MRLLLSPLLLAVLTACTAGMINPARPWGDQPVQQVAQKGNCTIYALVSDPHTYWVVCPPGGTLDPQQGRP